MQPAKRSICLDIGSKMTVKVSEAARLTVVDHSMHASPWEDSHHPWSQSGMHHSGAILLDHVGVC